ncbi:MAG TPA: adenylate kinase [Planctomycetes bacterium]|jgi:adenylate kinase|nr:adenylate kinase [Planctomycetota bacterium]
MIAILLGAPGVGKGTQAALAAETHGYTHMSTGELLRQEVAEDTELGKSADTYMSRGDLVPDDVMVQMVAEHISNFPSEKVLLLDGFPRTIAQAEALDQACTSGAIGLSLYFTAPETVLTDRLLARGRQDDTHEVIAHRLGVYAKATEPLVKHYADQGLLREIKSDRAVEDIQVDVLSIVSGVLNQSNLA